MESVWFWVFWICAFAVAYVHLLYLVLLRLVARKRLHEPCETSLANVSLIIPAYNEGEVLADKLENSLQVDYPSEKLEILVASDGSDDSTEEIARGFSDRGVRLLAYPARRGKAAVLNDAVAEATGDILCLCDANVMFRQDALAVMVRRLAEPNVGGVSGDVRLTSDPSTISHGERLYYRMERLVQLLESRVSSLIGVDGGMYVIRKELYQPLPKDCVLDDFVISMRVLRQGWRVVFEPQAVAEERGVTSIVEEFRRRIRVSAGAVQSVLRGEWPPLRSPVMIWQYFSHKMLRWLGPLFLIGLLCSSIGLAAQHKFYSTAAAVQFVFYLCAAVAACSVGFRRSRLGNIAFYFSMSEVAMAIGSVKGLLRRQRVTWHKAERALAKEQSPSVSAQ